VSLADEVGLRFHQSAPPPLDADRAEVTVREEEVMPSPGQELASIDFESMLGGPLIAVLNA
jgi:hypothetical protein